MDCLTDLHTHSKASDGTKSPTELVRIAKDTGLTSIALTDHDTIDGLAEFNEAGVEYNIETISGIELAAAYKNTELHIVGLFIDEKNKDLIASMKYIVNEREERNKKMLKVLKRLGVDISIEELEKNAGGNIITRAHYANVLTQKGYVQNNDEAFNKYIGSGKPGYVKRDTLTPKNCIEAIRNSGGIPILAHATLYGFNYLEIHSIVGELKKYGLMGMETLYSTYTQKQANEIRKICEHYNLLKSGGSDFHGDNKPDIAIGKGRGNLKIPQDFVDKMKEALHQ
ncbi:MAG: PHP domain-containing protein [Candidatus Metalachnospira sp.]|nr:PHP domain-containing protein [Candidatus Metalachnospira sp.]